MPDKPNRRRTNGLIVACVSVVVIALVVAGTVLAETHKHHPRAGTATSRLASTTTGKSAGSTTAETTTTAVSDDCHLKLSYPEAQLGQMSVTALFIIRNPSAMTCRVSKAPSVLLRSANGKLITPHYGVQNFGGFVPHVTNLIPPHGAGVFYLIFFGPNQQPLHKCTFAATMEAKLTAHDTVTLKGLAKVTGQRQPINPCQREDVTITPVGLNPELTGPSAPYAHS